MARSIAEAELRSVAHGVCETLLLKILLDEFKVAGKMPMRISYDNKAAINISHNLVITTELNILR